MRCPQCGHDNAAEMKFCGECGARLAAVCPTCGARNASTQKFCGECGARLATASTARQPSPHEYTPKHLAERILSSKASLEGERKQVTVLFADLKGSMELLADRDPEEARKILDPVLEHMMAAVHRYEGTVNQVMGDGIMALFGAPLAHEDHAVRACYAALRMQESVKRYAEGARREEGVTIRIRVGLNSGDVVVRAIGSDLHMDYTAVGQTTHLAARMEQLADPGAVVLTAATLGLAEDFLQVRALGPTPVKGMSEPIEVYELTGATAVRSRFQAHAARGLTRFVGRTSEMAQLAEGLELARNGRGQVVAVVGEPGVGKSRLFWEFAHSHRAVGCLVIEAASVSYGKATTYFPVSELLRGYFQIESRDDTRKIREKVTGKLLLLDRTLEPALPAVLALLDVPVEDEQWTRLDPPQRRRRTLDAVKRLLLRESQVQPLVVIFEDLHWIDGETQAVLDGLVESLPTARVLLLVNYRPEYQHAWGSKTYYRQLRIDALSSASAEELLEALLGNNPSVQPLKRVLIERTEGNPFFLEESVRTLVETKMLEGELSAYRLTRAPAGLQIPATAQAIVAARLDRLDPEDKRVLQAASVIGKDVSLPLLEAIVQLPEHGLGQCLARLQAAEFFYETRLFPEVEYTFKHALTQEVAYGSLLAERRRLLHALIVNAIERLYRDRLTERAEQLAHHALRGWRWAEALTYCQQAGTKALTRAAYRDAVAFFEHAIAALERLPDNAAKQEKAIDLRLGMGTPLFWLGDLPRRSHNLHEAETLARNLGDQRRLGYVWASLTHQCWIEGDPDGATEYGRRAKETGEAVEDRLLQDQVNCYLGMVHHTVGDYHRAITFLRKLCDFEGDGGSSREPRPGSPVLAVAARAWLIWSHADMGAFAEAERLAQEAVSIAEAANVAHLIVHAYHAFGLALALQGRVQDAIPVLERGLRLSVDSDIPMMFVLVAPVVGAVYTLDGRAQEAIDLLQHAIDVIASLRVGNYQSLAVGWLSEACLLTSRAGDAIGLAERALGLARRHNERGNEASIRRLLGEITARGGPLEAGIAEGHYRDAIALAEPRGMRPLVAHCHLGLGKLYRRTGKRQEAKEHLVTASTMYREMDMTYWLEQGEAEKGHLL